MRRAIFAFVTFVAFGQTATAGAPLLGHVSCAVVRFYVAKYSEAAAEKWARGHGANTAEIETARHCLHSATVQTASSAVRSQVVVPVTVKEPAQQEATERNPDQEALHVEPVQQRDNPDIRDKKPSLVALSLPEDLEDRPAAQVGNEMKDRPIPSDGKTSTGHRRPARVHHVGTAGVTGNVKWLKRLWGQLTSPRQFRVAFLHFRGSRQ